MTQHTHHHPRLLVIALVALAVLLTGCMGQLGTSWAGLTILEDNTRLVYAHENTLAVLDIATGNPIPLVDSDGNRLVDQNNDPLGWEVNGRDLDNAQFFASPLQLSSETLLAPTSDGRLLTFDLVTADVRSGINVQERGSLVSELALTDDTLLVGLQQQLLALSIDDGSLQTRWSAEADHAVWAKPTVVDETTIYFVSLDHHLYAIDYETGERNWDVDLGGAAAGSPTYDPASNRLYVGTFGSQILSIDAETGDILARYDTAEWVWGAPILVEEPGNEEDEDDPTLALYAADLGGTVYKLDPETMTDGDGWRNTVAEGAIRTPPVVFGDYVVVGSRDEHVYWLDRGNGNLESECQFDGEVLSDILYFGADQIDDLDEDILIISTLSNRDALVAMAARPDENVDCESRREWTYP